MALPFRKILSPVDFGENSLGALNVAANLARQGAGTVLVLHVVTLVMSPGEVPAEIDSIVRKKPRPKKSSRTSSLIA